MDTAELRKSFVFNCAKFEYEVEALDKIHKYYEIKDVNPYFLLIARKLVTIFYSADLLCECGDIVSANALCRIIADNYASLHLIYKKSNGEEQTLRYLLFLLDAVCTLEKGLLKRPSKGSMSDELYSFIMSQADEQAIRNNKYKDEIIKQIKELSIFVQSPTFDKIVENSNWRYKELNSTKSYSWYELYQMSFPDNKIPFIISRYLSTYVHGLAISNFSTSKDELNFRVTLVYSILLVYLSQIMELLHTIFGNDIQTNKVNFSESERCR